MRLDEARVSGGKGVQISFHASESPRGQVTLLDANLGFTWRRQSVVRPGLATQSRFLPDLNGSVYVIASIDSLQLRVAVIFTFTQPDGSL